MRREMEQHNLDLLGELGKRLERAELALNRHGFTQAHSGDWSAPGSPNWAGALELRDHLTVHFPDIAAQNATLNQKAMQALILSEQRRFNAASEWLRSSIPTLFDEVVPSAPRWTPQEAPVTAIEDMLVVEPAEPIEQAPRTLRANGEPMKVIWPDPKNANFTVERRDPMSYQERHTGLSRRWNDED